ncbi:MAG: hypothetical protein K8E66_14205, partial [Phycisphaerales bacterium]|nr:hypothetical protein [Phycisphaerales bacterium]
MTRAIPLSLILALLTGCASPWQRTYEPATPEVFEPTERVIIRQVPWARVNDALHGIEAERAASDVHPDDMDASRRADEHARLVIALQLSEDPTSVVVLGRSVFRSTSNIDLLDGSLSGFAQSIGADYAIWSTSYLGKAQ